MSKVFIPKSISAKLNGVISRGVLAMEIDERGHLIVTLTDNTEVDLGKVKGDSGVYVGAEEPTDDSVLVWITVDEGDVPDEPDEPEIPDIPDVPDVPVKLAVPSIWIESDSAVKLTSPTIRLDTGDDSEYTPAILGVAILGRTILGKTDGYEPTITQLTAPSIRIETEEEEPTIVQLTAPSIKLETVVYTLDAPEIELVEV